MLPASGTRRGTDGTTPAALAVKCITQANSGSAPAAATFTLTLACTPGPGDALIASVYAAGSTAPAGAGAVTADLPAGFTLIGGTPTYSGALGQSTLAYKIAAGTESAISVTDPGNNAFIWAVTVYDVQSPGTIAATSVATSSLLPTTAAISPSAANSVAIGIWTVQNSDTGPPNAPGFYPPGGWTKGASTPQYTRLAGIANDVLQGNGYRALTGTAAITGTATFYNGGNLATQAGVAQMIVVGQNPGAAIRRGFLGAFFRAIGNPAYGVFSASATQVTPQPYPTPGRTLFGSTGYCDQIASNGVSISSGLPVDATKLADVVNLGVKWTRSTISADFIDQSHIFGAGSYAFQTLDSSQCALVRNNIKPVIGLEAGPVDYDAVPNTYSPTELPIYKTAADFGQYCGVVAQHENAVLGPNTRYSLPDNEVNTNTTMFTGGATQIAAYSEACYQAIKAAQPASFVYGFELNMDYDVNAPAFVAQLYALGCKIGTCYDGIAMHLYLPYPLPSSGTPCFPNPGGNYDMQCVTDVRTAANQPALHVLISETAFMVPSTVPDEETKATATVAAMELFSLDPNVDGVAYANVDECALYPTGEFSGGCLINTAGVDLPAYGALQALAQADY